MMELHSSKPCFACLLAWWWWLCIMCGGVMMNRRIYDPRRWHKRSSSSGIHASGQPPAGWVLIWAGRFKRWRRRWFVAHPPGLLLHYKNSDQIGGPGCINLLVSIPTPFLPSFPSPSLFNFCWVFGVNFICQIASIPVDWVVTHLLLLVGIMNNREQQLFLQQARSGNSRSSRARLFTIFEP